MSSSDKYYFEGEQKTVKQLDEYPPAKKSWLQMKNPDQKNKDNHSECHNNLMDLNSQLSWMWWFIFRCAWLGIKAVHKPQENCRDRAESFWLTKHWHKVSISLGDGKRVNGNITTLTLWGCSANTAHTNSCELWSITLCCPWLCWGTGFGVTCSFVWFMENNPCSPHLVRPQF